MSRLIYCYEECYYAERHYAECRYAERRSAKCHHAECRSADCRGAALTYQIRVPTRLSGTTYW